MAYGTIKVDTITFTDGAGDKSVTISGLVQNPTFTGNVTVTGTVSGTTATFTTGTFTSLTGTTSQGTTATYTSGSFTSLTGVTTSGTTANFVSGVFTTQISGATITGTAGAFATLTGGVATLTSGVFALGTQALPSITFTGDTDTGIYSPGANQVAITTSGTGRLFVNASGLVGVGTSSPSTLLTLLKNTQGGVGPEFLAANDFGTTGSEVVIVGRTNGACRSGMHIVADDGGTGTGNGNYLYFTTTPAGSTTETPRMTITRSGNVGINTTILPGNKLTVGDGNSSADNSIVKFNTGDAAASALILSNWTGSATLNGPRIGFDNSSRGSFVLGCGDGVNDFYLGNGTSRFWTVDASGRLLVGTSSSRSTAIGDPRFQVEGTTYSESSVQMICNSAADAFTCAHLAFGRSKTTAIGGTGQVVDGDRLGAISWNGAQNSTLSSIAGLIECYVDGEVQTGGDTTDMPGRLVFSTTRDNQASPTEACRIDSSQRLLIGTGSATVSSTKLQIGATSGTSNNVLLANNGTESLVLYFVQPGLTTKSITTTTNDRINVFSNHDTSTGVYLAAGGTSWTSTSDERLKENLEPITDSFSKISGFRCVVGNYINDPAKKRMPFLLAQDVEQVLPEAVDSTDPNELGLSYTALIPLLVAALKESKERIETLEAKVAALESA